MTVSEMFVPETKQARQKNTLIVQDVAAGIGSNQDLKDLEKKILGYIERNGLNESVAQIKDEIVEKRLFAACFAKDPSKQNIAERIQLRELKPYGVEKLPNTGPNALYLIDGKIQPPPAIKGIHKSIDATYGDRYMTLKYTKVEGGSQDNQKNDVINFIENSGDHKVAAIIDGPYYQTDGIQKEFAQYKSDRVFIGTTDEFIKEKRAGTI